MIIGIDLDNTLVGYDALFARTARTEGFLSPDQLGTLAPGKTALRDLLRAQPDGETRWRELQALVYGREIRHAEPFEGVQEFLALCQRQGVPAYVVSHKTPTASCQGQVFDLRAEALAWMEQSGLLDPAASPLTRAQVFFESERSAKIERIRALGCTVFIDDLVELFLEPEFPAEVGRILFLPQGQSQGDSRSEPDAALPWRTLRSWQAIQEHLLGRGPC